MAWMQFCSKGTQTLFHVHVNFVDPWDSLQRLIRIAIALFFFFWTFAYYTNVMSKAFLLASKENISGENLSAFFGCNLRYCVCGRFVFEVWAHKERIDMVEALKGNIMMKYTFGILKIGVSNMSSTYSL